MMAFSAGDELAHDGDVIGVARQEGLEQQPVDAGGGVLGDARLCRFPLERYLWNT